MPPNDENARSTRAKANDSGMAPGNLQSRDAFFRAGTSNRSNTSCGGQDCGAGKLQLNHDSTPTAVRGAVGSERPPLQRANVSPRKRITPGSTLPHRPELAIAHNGENRLGPYLLFFNIAAQNGMYRTAIRRLLRVPSGFAGSELELFFETIIICVDNDSGMRLSQRL